MFKSFLSKHSLTEYQFHSDIFPTIEDRAFWDTFQDATCVAEAEAELAYEWPTIRATAYMEYKKSGDRNIMEDVHFGRRNHLVLFALAELKENKGRFLPQIVDGLFSICEESYWGVSAHWIHGAKNIPTPAEPYIDLFAAETAEHLAMITHLLRGPLAAYCPEILDRVDYELEVRIKQLYLTHFDYWWMGYGRRSVNNWNPWILSNLLTVFLLTESKERRLHRALAKMLEEIQFYYDSMPADGGCDEGPSYWIRAGASLFEFLYQLKAATGGALDLFADEKICAIAAYLQKVHITDDLFANIADAHCGGHADFMLLLYGYARETKQGALMNFSAAVYHERSDVLKPFVARATLRRLIYHSEFLHEIVRYPVTYPLHGTLEYLPDLQFAALRKGDLYLSAKGGHNDESHNHNDVGSFALYDSNTPVLIDVGIGTYTRFTFQRDTRYTMIPWTQTYTHNLPLLNGKGQCFGKCFCADHFSATTEGIEISFAGAYPAEAGITSLTRALALTEHGMICTDRFAFATAASDVTERLITTLPVQILDGVAILGDRYRVTASCGELSGEYLPFADSVLEKDWKADGIHCLSIEASGVTAITLTIEKL